MKVESLKQLQDIIYKELVDAHNASIVDGCMTVVSFAFDPKTCDLLVGDEDNDFMVTNEYNYVVSEVDSHMDKKYMVDTACYIAEELTETEL